MVNESSLPPAAIERRVLLVVHNPSIPEAGGALLSQALGWNDPGGLVSAFIEEIAHCSHGIARFRLQGRIDVDEIPRKADGFRYTSKSFLECWRRRAGFHAPDLVDYPLLVAQFGLLDRVLAGEIDEVWLFAFPYAGYYESIMAGRSPSALCRCLRQSKVPSRERAAAAAPALLRPP